MTDIVLLDGGMGQELVHRSGDTPTPLWATQIMLDHPHLVESIHADYFAAGATVATTNTYALHHDRLDGTPLADRFEALYAAAITQAKAARARHGSGRIAGSIGPLAASYRPDAHPPLQEAVPRYREVARLLAGDVDFLLCETVASLEHADAVLGGTQGTGKPVWISVTVDDEDGTLLRSGEALSELAGLLDGRAAAVLANCSAPEAMPAALDVLAGFDLPFGAYANGFKQITKAFLEERPTVDALDARRDLGPQAYAEHVMGWVAQGATIVGGCCEVGPRHIESIAQSLTAQGHTIV